jgi:hypothetical protein
LQSSFCAVPMEHPPAPHAKEETKQTIQSQKEEQTKFLFCGLGGGLDVVNASILYFVSLNEAKPAVLGSIRPCPLENISRHGPAFSSHGTILTKDSLIGIRGRYAEPRVAALLTEIEKETHSTSSTSTSSSSSTPASIPNLDLSGSVLYFSRYESQAEEKQCPSSVEASPSRSAKLRQAIETARDKFGISHMFFCDGGGDSLILRESDGCTHSEHTNPFVGGDAEALKALHGIPNVYLAVVAVGLDIDRGAFARNLVVIKERGGYFGRVNLHTGEQDEFTLGHLLAFKEGWLENYRKLAETILVLKEEDKRNESKTMSHTATVSYHAICGNFGLQRTFVQWEPVQEDGERGVVIDRDHCWLYFFNPTILEQLKFEFNNRTL